MFKQQTDLTFVFLKRYCLMFCNRSMQKENSCSDKYVKDHAVLWIRNRIGSDPHHFAWSGSGSAFMAWWWGSGRSGSISIPSTCIFFPQKISVFCSKQYLKLWHLCHWWERKDIVNSHCWEFPLYFPTCVKLEDMMTKSLGWFSVVRTICDRRAGERGGGAPAAQDSQEGAGQGGRRRGSLHTRSRNTSWPNRDMPIVNSNRRLSIQTADYQFKPPIINSNRRLSSQTADYQFKPPIINSNLRLSIHRRLSIQTADYQGWPREAAPGEPPY